MSFLIFSGSKFYVLPLKNLDFPLNLIAKTASTRPGVSVPTQWSKEFAECPEIKVTVMFLFGFFKIAFSTQIGFPSSFGGPEVFAQVREACRKNFDLIS